MKIQVTQEDIDKGIKGRVDACPIALAIKRSTKFKTVKVGSGFIDWIDEKDKWMRYGNGPIDDFITAFDRYLPVEPFDFKLEHEYK